MRQYAPHAPRLAPTMPGPDWDALWSNGLDPGTKFDVGCASPTLTACLSHRNFAPRAGMKALVPGCGRAYDALALADHGFDEVVAIDIASAAVEAAQGYLAKSEAPAATKVKCVAADFFEHRGSYDFIWDCTFLCALDPSMHERWAAHQRSLLAPHGVLASCVFPIRDGGGGPPFALTPVLLRSLLELTGLTCEDIDITESEWHFPKGVGSGGTALLLAHS